MRYKHLKSLCEWIALKSKSIKNDFENSPHTETTPLSQRTETSKKCLIQTHCPYKKI